MHDYEIHGYTSHHLYSIQEKYKGSGLAIYYRDTLNYKSEKSLTFRNDFFECLGGKLKCEIGNINIIVLYRYSRSEKLAECIGEQPSFLEKIGKH